MARAATAAGRWQLPMISAVVSWQCWAYGQRGEAGEEVSAVAVVTEDRAAFDPTADHVMEDAGRVESRPTGHGILEMPIDAQHVKYVHNAVCRICRCARSAPASPFPTSPFPRS